jgi:hypothetical protein
MHGGTAPKSLQVMAPMFRELAFFAPDGQWLTYVSSESGRSEIYVRPFDSQSPTGGGKTRVSTDGGDTRWSADGSEIFYMTASGEMMAVDVTTKQALVATAPFSYQRFAAARDLYATSPSAQRPLFHRRVPYNSAVP